MLPPPVEIWGNPCRWNYGFGFNHSARNVTPRGGGVAREDIKQNTGSILPSGVFFIQHATHIVAGLIDWYSIPSHTPAWG